jgi:hypothetical protein
MKFLATTLVGLAALAGAAAAQTPTPAPTPTQTPAPTDGKAALKAGAAKAAAPKPAGMSDRAMTKQGGPVAVGVSPAVRNWAEIDTNGDNLIGPDEMEKWLQAQWAAAKK